jgi:hypothetical protein
MESEMKPDQILNDYRKELATAIEWKLGGRVMVHPNVAGAELADGRNQVPIDEYIRMWEDGIAAMEAGADQRQYDY